MKQELARDTRKLDGFQNFITPKSLATLQSSAANSPAVMLNASQAACTALVLTSSGVKQVPLPGITLTTAEELVTLIRHVATSVATKIPEATPNWRWAVTGHCERSHVQVRQ